MQKLITKSSTLGSRSSGASLGKLGRSLERKMVYQVNQLDFLSKQ